MALSELRTPRLVLRPVRASDVDALTVLFAGPEVRRFLFDDAPVTRAITEHVVARFLAIAEGTSGLGLRVIVRAEDPSVIAGCVGLSEVEAAAEHVPALRGAIESVVALAPSVWGNGYAREALACVLDHAERALGLGTIVAVVDVPNVRSLRLVESLGFVGTGEHDGPRYRMRAFSRSRER